MKIIISFGNKGGITRYIIKYFYVVIFAMLLLGFTTYFAIKESNLPVANNNVKLGWFEKFDVPIYKVKTDEKKVSLTFNCAWSNTDIQKILNVLERHKIKSTFFMVGDWVQRYPETVKVIETYGHDVSSHGNTHTKYTKIDNGRIRKELIDFKCKVQKILGKEKWKGQNLIRTPYGDWNKKVVKLISEEGYNTIQWSVDSLDWMPDKTSTQIIDKVCDNISNGDIVLLHSGAAHTADCLETIVDKIIEKGYTIVPVSDLIYNSDFTIDNNGLQSKIVNQ